MTNDITTLKDKILEEVEALDYAGLWDKWEEVRGKLKTFQVIEDIIKDRLWREMGERESLPLKDNAGVYVQYAQKWEVPTERASVIIDDPDLLLECVRIDLKKAKEVLPPELYKELEQAKVANGEPTKRLMTGKVKEC